MSGRRERIVFYGRPSAKRLPRARKGDVMIGLNNILYVYRGWRRGWELSSGPWPT